MSSGESPTSPVLKARIEAFTGAQPMIVLTDHIRQSVAKVLELIPEHLLASYVTPLYGIGSGISVANKKVMRVNWDGREISEMDAGRYMDPGSIYYVANSRDTVYWISQKTLHTLPEDADIEVIDYSAVAETDTEINCLPPQFTEAVVLDVAIQMLCGQISQIASELFDLNIALARSSDTVNLVYPSAVGTLSLAWTDIATIDASVAAMSTGLITCLNELSTVKTAIEGDLASGTEDIELGMARMSHAKSLMDEYSARADVIFKQLLADSDVDKLNKVKAYEKTIEDAHNDLGRASQELELFTSHGQLLVNQRKEKNDQVVGATALIQVLSTRFQSFFAPFQPARAQ